MQQSSGRSIWTVLKAYSDTGKLKSRFTVVGRLLCMMYYYDIPAPNSCTMHILSPCDAMPMHMEVKPSLRMFSRCPEEAIHCSTTNSAATLSIPDEAKRFSPNAVKDIPFSVRAVWALEPSGLVCEKDTRHSRARVSAAACMAEE